MSQHWTRRIPFKVDVAGIIEIMGTSLYSRATTPVRELIQNAHDGIMRRRQRDLSYTGRIDLTQDPAAHTITFSDDGIGLSEEEAERYLGTLGIGMTGLIKKAAAGEEIEPESAVGRVGGDGQSLIGQFGIGLFSAFMLADRLVVETKRVDADRAVRWEAGAGSDIELSSCDRTAPGTSVTLHLKPRFYALAEQSGPLEEAVKEYADFLPVPIHLNGSAARANLINAAWFDPTPDREAVELELENFFGETALDVIPVRLERPVPVAGALYVTPHRTPGFSGEAVVSVTVRRMVISRQIRGLMPEWASFLRGVLELNGCSPTASREDLVRDANFDAARETIERLLFEHFEGLAQSDPTRLAAVINWHRYTLAGAALSNRRLRDLMRHTYPLSTSRGTMTFDQVLGASEADPLFEAEAGHVIWFNSDRRQEHWANTVFASHASPCVHTVRSFEEALVAAMAGAAMEDAAAAKADATELHGPVELRPASPSSPNFARSVLGLTDMEDAPEAWQTFLESTGARVYTAVFDDEKLPVMAFLNERHELLKTFEDLKKTGNIPSGFQRLIDAHFGGGGGNAAREDSSDQRAAPRADRNEVVLNRGHALVKRALSQSTSHPLASVLRMLVVNGLAAAGAAVPPAAQRLQSDDLNWVAGALGARQQQPRPGPS